MLTDQQKIARGRFAHEMRKRTDLPLRKVFRSYKGDVHHALPKSSLKGDWRYCWSGLAFAVMKEDPPTFSFETPYTPKMHFFWMNDIPSMDGFSWTQALCEWLGISIGQFDNMVRMNDQTTANWGTLANATITLPVEGEESLWR